MFSFYYLWFEFSWSTLVINFFIVIVGFIKVNLENGIQWKGKLELFLGENVKTWDFVYYCKIMRFNYWRWIAVKIRITGNEMREEMKIMVQKKSIWFKVEAWKWAKIFSFPKVHVEEDKNGGERFRGFAQWKYWFYNHGDSVCTKRTEQDLSSSSTLGIKKDIKLV